MSFQISFYLLWFYSICSLLILGRDCGILLWFWGQIAVWLSLIATQSFPFHSQQYFFHLKVSAGTLISMQGPSSWYMIELLLSPLLHSQHWCSTFHPMNVTHKFTWYPDNYVALLDPIKLLYVQCVFLNQSQLQSWNGGVQCDENTEGWSLRLISHDEFDLCCNVFAHLAHCQWNLIWRPLFSRSHSNKLPALLTVTLSHFLLCI